MAALGGPGVEVRRGSLEDRLAGTGHCVLLVERLRLVLIERVGEAVVELLVGEGYGPVAVGGVPEHRRGRPQGGHGQRQHAAKRCRSMATDAADSPRPARIWVSNPPKLWPIHAGCLPDLFARSTCFNSSSVTVRSSEAVVFLAMTVLQIGCSYSPRAVADSHSRFSVIDAFEARFANIARARSSRDTRACSSW